MPFEPGDTEETLRARGLSDIEIERIRKYHMPTSSLSPELREKRLRTEARLAEMRSKGQIAKPREGDNFAPGYREGEGLYPVQDETSEPAAPAPERRAEDHEWDGVTLRNTYQPQEVARRDQIADAARNGHWPHLLGLLETRYVNRVRLGGAEGFAPLHQVAWHGAPVEVAQRLVELGAWRLLRTTAGQTPLAIARQRGHQHLFGVLQPVVRHPLADEVLRELEEHLTMLIRGGRYADFVVRQQLRLPQLGPVTELTEPKVWFPVPGQYGGMDIELDGTELTVSNWSRVGGWRLVHRVTRSSVHFVEERIDAPGVPSIVRSAEPGG
ncbi:hypothetical protein [Amycolatopsis sp. cmx-4-68]|uniref:hypothetical protein n=1 Tax=Amycolatopsis sp. cmx-4-68 TaxID=2790938 RepID=UPI00397BF916